MFVLMHKYRVFILVFLFAGLFGWGAWTAIEDLFKRGPANILLATYRVPGESEPKKIFDADRREVLAAMESVRFDAKTMKQYLRLGGDDDLDKVVFAFIMMRSAAEKAGILIPEDVVRGKDENGNPRLVAESQLKFFKDLQAVMQFRSMFERDAVGSTYPEIWDQFKAQHEDVKGRLLVFTKKAKADFQLDKSKPEDIAKLREWWEKPENQHHRDAKKVPEKFDLEFAVVSFKNKTLQETEKEFTENWAELTKEFEITDVSCLARWNRLDSQYQLFFVKKEMERRQNEQEAETKKAKEENRDPKNLFADTQPSEYEIVKEQIRRELKLGKLFTKMMDEVKGKGDTALRDLCSTNRIQCLQLSKVSADEVQSHELVGNPRLKGLLQKASAQNKAKTLADGAVIEYETESSQTGTQYTPRVFDEPANFIAIPRLITRYDERAAELNDVAEFAIEEWQKKQADGDLIDRVKAFHAGIDAKVLEIPSIKEAKARLDAECDAAIAKEMAEQTLDRANDEHKPRIELLEKRHQAERDAKLKTEKQGKEAEALVVLAKEQNLDILETGWIRKSMSTYMTYADELPMEEKIARLLRSSSVIYGMGALQEGRVSEPPTMAEPQSPFASLMILDGKRPPAESEMLLRPDKARAFANAGANRNANQQDDFQYKNFCNAEWFDLWAWEIEKYATRAAEQKAKNKLQDEEYARVKSEQAFRRQQAVIEERRKKEAEAPQPPKPPEVPPTPPGDGK